MYNPVNLRYIDFMLMGDISRWFDIFIVTKSVAHNYLGRLADYQSLRNCSIYINELKLSIVIQ